jgi:hypothetical protein
MNDFIKSLNKTQRQGFVDLIKKNSAMLPAFAYVVEESLNGNPGPYEEVFGKDHTGKFQKHSGESLDPAVVSYTARKMAEHARLESENNKRVQADKNKGFNQF